MLSKTQKIFMGDLKHLKRSYYMDLSQIGLKKKWRMMMTSSKSVHCNSQLFSQYLVCRKDVLEVKFKKALEEMGFQKNLDYKANHGILYT